MATIAVIDYGMGNLHSMAKAVEHVAPADRVIVTCSAEQILDADKVVFPGQGAAPDCMREIASAGLVDVLVEAAQQKPFLGVCMGLQVLMSRSEEGGGTACLNIFPGDVRYFGQGLHDAESGQRLKIPQMGWNRVTQQREHPLWHGIDDGARFYFVHSYYIVPEDGGLIVGTTDYSREYASALACANIFAVQFHPEKSQNAGLQLLKNFAQWDGLS